MMQTRWGRALFVLVAVSSSGATSVLAAPFLFVANHGDDTVSIIDVATNRVTGTIAVGHQPIGVAVDPEGAHVYVSNQDGTNGSVSVITAGTNAVTDVPVSDDPTGVAVKLPGTRVYVANRLAKSVSVIDTSTNEVVATVEVEDNPLGIAIDPAGTPAYVANRGSDSVSVIDTETNEVIRTIPIPGAHPTHVAVSPTGERVYVTSEGNALVSIINSVSLAVTGTVSVGAVPDGVVFSLDGRRAYVANSGPDTLSVLDTTLGSVIQTIPVGAQPEDLAIHPDGSRVYVMNRADNTVAVIDSATNAELDTDGDATNGITRIPVGHNPVALENGLLPSLTPPRFSKEALACQAAIAAQARAYVKADQGQQTSCQVRIVKALSAGKETQQTEAICTFAIDLGNPTSTLARARSSARDAVLKKCAVIAPAAIDRPCDRAAGSIAEATDCILDQHTARVAEMVVETFGAGNPQALSKPALACQATIAKAASQFAQAEQAQLSGCLVRVLKNTTKGKAFSVAARACAKTLDPRDVKASLPRLRAALTSKIAKKCSGLIPAAIGAPCDSAAATIGGIAACILDGHATRVQKMIAAEFNDACPLLTAVGLGRAYPDVCSGH